MALQSQLSKIAYEGNGSTSTPYAIPFPFITASDIKVYVDDAQLLSGYTVIGAGEESGGSLTTDLAYSSEQEITIAREMELTQNYSYSVGDRISSAVVEQNQDVQVMQIQQVDRKVSTSLKVSDGTGTDSLTVPMRVGTTLGFSEAGQFEAREPGEQVEHLGIPDMLDEAAQSAAAASASADEAEAERQACADYAAQVADDQNILQLRVGGYLELRTK